MGTQQVAWLNFTAVSNQSSAFVNLSLTGPAGPACPTAPPIANFAPQAGRVVVVGEEPLLEMVLNTNRQPLLVLYGKPASGYSIESRPNLWAGGWQVVLKNLTVTTNLFLEFVPPNSAEPANYYRALRILPPTPPRLEARLTPGGSMMLVLRGVVGARYTIESTAGLGDGGSWEPALEHVLVTNSVQEILLAPPGAPAKFCRAKLE